jgi:Protein of unknown function (DUF4230)
MFYGKKFLDFTVSGSLRGDGQGPSAIQVMVTPVTMTTERRRTSAGTVLLATLLGILIGLGALAIFVREATYGIWDQVASKITGRTLSINTSQPTVVDKIQRLERLETVTYTMDKAVEGDRTSAILPDFLVGDKLLLNVHGEAIAGVDLSQLKPSDVVVHGKVVDVHLPAAQLFVVALDSGKTKVYSRSTGFFVQADPDLETEVRAKAEQQLRDSALSAGILDTARKNAASTVSKLLLGLGFEQVQVN